MGLYELTYTPPCFMPLFLSSAERTESMKITNDNSTNRWFHLIYDRIACLLACLRFMQDATTTNSYCSRMYNGCHTHIITLSLICVRFFLWLQTKTHIKMSKLKMKFQWQITNYDGIQARCSYVAWSKVKKRQPVHRIFKLPSRKLMNYFNHNEFEMPSVREESWLKCQTIQLGCEIN